MIRMLLFSLLWILTIIYLQTLDWYPMDNIPARIISGAIIALIYGKLLRIYDI